MPSGILRAALALFLAAAPSFAQDVAVVSEEVNCPARVEREQDFTVSGQVRNAGEAPLQNVVVRYFLGGLPVLDDVTIETLPPGETAPFEAALRLPDDGVWVFEVVVDPEDAIHETDEENNSFTAEIAVGQAPAEGEPQAAPPPTANVPEVEEEEPPLPEGWETAVHTRTEARHYTVGGNRNRSSLEHGWREEENADVQLRRQWGEDESFQADASARWTDERRADPEPFSLKRSTFQLNLARFAGEAGDTSPSFSQYTLGGGLRGAHVTVRPGEPDTWEIAGVAGTNKPRWEMHWDHTDGEPPDRITTGVRVARRFAEENAIGVQYVHCHDVSEGLTRPHNSPRLQSDVAGVDGNWAFNDWLSAEGEFAQSFGDLDRRFDEGIRPAWALHGELKAKGETLDACLSYERVHPNFVTGAGSASADRETYSGRFGWQALEPLGFHYSIRAHRDNLDHNKAHTTRSLEHVVEIDLSGPDFAPDLRAGLFWSEAMRATETTTHELTRSIRPSVEHPIGPFTASLEYEYRESFEYRANSGDSRSDSWRVGLTVPVELGGDWTLDAGVAYRTEMVHDRDAGTHDRTGFVELTAHLQMPWNLAFEATVSGTDNNRDAADSDSRNRNQRFSLTWTPRENLRASATLDRRGNDFQTADGDYDETTVGLNVEWDF